MAKQTDNKAPAKKHKSTSGNGKKKMQAMENRVAPMIATNSMATVLVGNTVHLAPRTLAATSVETSDSFVKPLDATPDDAAPPAATYVSKNFHYAATDAEIVKTPERNAVYGGPTATLAPGAVAVKPGGGTFVVPSDSAGDTGGGTPPAGAPAPDNSDAAGAPTATISPTTKAGSLKLNDNYVAGSAGGPGHLHDVHLKDADTPTLETRAGMTGKDIVGARLRQGKSSTPS